MSYIRRAFGGSGEDRISGIVTKAHASAGGGGLIGGFGVGVLVWGFALPTILLGIACGLIGITLVIRVNGLTVFDRLWLRGGFWARRSMHATFVPPSVQASPPARAMTVFYNDEVVAFATSEDQ